MIYSHARVASSHFSPSSRRRSWLVVSVDRSVPTAATRLLRPWRAMRSKMFFALSRLFSASLDRCSLCARPVPVACRRACAVSVVGARAPPRRPPFYYMWTHVPMSMFFFRAVGRGRFCWRRCAGLSFVLARSAPSDTATTLHPTRSIRHVPFRLALSDTLAPSDTLHSDSHTRSIRLALPTRNGTQRSITATYAQHLHLAWRWLLATSIC